MKRLFLTILLFLCVVSGRAEFFSATNSQGLLLWYAITSDSTVMLCGSDTVKNSPSTDKNNYSYITIDTLIIPEEVVSNEGIRYKMVQISPKGAFNHINSLTTIYLPKTLKMIGDSMYYSEYSGDDAGHDYVRNLMDRSRAFIHSPNLRNIFVDHENPYYASIDGVVYTKDFKTLIAYPEGKTNDTLAIVNGCEHIGRYAVYENPYVKVIDFPNSLKSIGVRAFAEMDGFESLIIRDSVERIGFEAFPPSNIPTKKMHIGSGLRIVADHALPYALDIYCYAVKPPSYSPAAIWNDSVKLAVPRQSLLAYQQHPEWGKCKDIRPIEPPIVTGVDTASVSWVQNFSATGYVLTLYTDEARAQRFMSLTFDANGHLTHIDINNGHMPARMPALYNEDGEEEKRFAEYYSFTISGLSPDTKYYYTRQSMNGTEVIDEEAGSFETLSDGEEGLEQNSVFSSEPQKMIKDGQMLIRSGNATYNVQGSNIRE